MFWRTFIFSLFLLAGVLVGEVLLPIKNYWESAFISLLVTCFVLYLFDINRASTTLSWLKGDDLQAPPFLRGVWGEIGDRVVRVVKMRERETLKSNARLTEFLAAIQASPHGVLLINPEGRIEWSNEMAKVHLGIDLQRDKDQLIGNLVRDPAYTAYAHSLVYDHEVVIEGVQSQFQNYRFSVPRLMHALLLLFPCSFGSLQAKLVSKLLLLCTQTGTRHASLVHLALFRQS